MAVVIANYIRPGRQARAKAKATLLYNAERLGREKQEINRILFGWQGPMDRQEAELLIDRAPKGTVFFRVMINFDPLKEDPDKLLNIWEIVRKTYETLERSLGLEGKIQFIAALHDDHTSLRHIHSLMLVPHRLTKEQFRAIAFVPRAAASGQALAQRQTLDLNQMQAGKLVRPLTVSRPPEPLLSPSAPHQRAENPGKTRRGQVRRAHRSSVNALPPPSCPRDASQMKRTKRGFRCPACGYWKQQEISFNW